MMQQILTKVINTSLWCSVLESSLQSDQDIVQLILDNNISSKKLPYIYIEQIRVVDISGVTYILYQSIEQPSVCVKYIYKCFYLTVISVCFNNHHKSLSVMCLKIE